MALPSRGHQDGIWQSVGRDEGLHWGAFGTADFDRLRPTFDTASYATAELQEELRNALIRFGMVQERLTLKARLEALARLESGATDLGATADDDMRAYAKWYLRARSLRRRIRQLSEIRWTGGAG